MDERTFQLMEERAVKASATMLRTPIGVNVEALITLTSPGMDEVNVTRTPLGTNLDGSEAHRNLTGSPKSSNSPLIDFAASFPPEKLKQRASLAATTSNPPPEISSASDCAFFVAALL